MVNELLFLITILVEFLAIFIAFRLGKEWLYGTILINITLISTLGAKLTSIFGLTTNVGNVFFASVFIATHILVEHYGAKIGYKVAWMGFASIILFVTMTQFSVGLQPVPQTMGISNAIAIIFGNTPRIALASMLGFLLVQHINVWLYAKIKQKTGDKYLWLRDNVANFVGQLVDSITFFSIAFYGVVSSHILIESMLTGFLVKVLVGALGTAVVYASRLGKNQAEAIYESAR